MQLLILVFSVILFLKEIRAEIRFDFLHGIEGFLDAKGLQPAYFDSPTMNLTIATTHTLVFRYRGKIPKASLQLRFENKEQHDISFQLEDDGYQWKIVYLSLEGEKQENVGKKVSKIRFYFPVRALGINPIDYFSMYEHGVHIDWMRISRSPIIHRITGCNGEKYSNDESYDNIHYGVGPIISERAGNVVHYRTQWKSATQQQFRFASTFNCLHEGGEMITIEGENFGKRAASVTIDNVPCHSIAHDIHNPEKRLMCITPRSIMKDRESYHQSSLIEVRNGKLPGLSGQSRQMSYASIIPSPRHIQVANVASRSLDLGWTHGGHTSQHMTTTGFRLYWRKDFEDDWSHSMVVGNITLTSFRNLDSATDYIFGISALNENQTDSTWWNSLDEYGRREPLLSALEGPIETIRGRTLRYDVDIGAFNANSTLNHGAIFKNPVNVQSQGEGHYGLNIVGSSNIQNCNTTSFCCDSYSEDQGECLKKDTSMTCAVQGATILADESSSNGNKRVIGKFLDYPILDWSFFTTRCGPSMRLTPPIAMQIGAFWYGRKMQVSEGFDTTFSFKLSNPSHRCNNMDKIHSTCSSVGGDGFAFVIQNDSIDSLGKQGMGLGYDGIRNAIAVEFDTYYNFETLDPYRNHVSVHTGGPYQISSNHSHSIAYTNAVPLLTEGEIVARIRYVPFLSAETLISETFSPYFQRGDFESGSKSNWYDPGLGTLSIFIQNMNTPVLSVPLHIPGTLDLDNGRAWIGFTAATGEETYQSHDILSFFFSSLRMDRDDNFLVKRHGHEQSEHSHDDSF